MSDKHGPDADCRECTDCPTCDGMGYTMDNNLFGALALAALIARLAYKDRDEREER